MVLASEPQEYSLPKDFGEMCSSLKNETWEEIQPFPLLDIISVGPPPHLQFLLSFGNFEGSWPKNETDMLKKAEHKKGKTDAVFVLT